MTKKELRKLYLTKRKALTEAEYQLLNQQLYSNFFASFDLSFVRVLHTYLPIHQNREPDTWPIIDRIRREFPHIRIVIPRVNKEADLLDHFYFEGLHQLQRNDWGIDEPKQGIPAEPEKIDVVLVPLLAFDNNRHRLGYGKGYYDRFLKTCRPDVKKIGLSFYEPEQSLPEIHADDVPLTAVITPYRWY